MNLRRIECFLAVVDAGTVTAAAAQLHVAQPALSRQLKTFERELRLRLFEAQGARIVLTSAGRALIPSARRLLAEAREFREASDVLQTGRVERLVAATTSASLRGFLAPFIATTTPADPKIIVREFSHFDTSEAVRRGCDFAISPAAPEGDLNYLLLGRVPLKAFVAPEHSWARAGVHELPISAFDGVPALIASRHSASRFILDDALSRSGVALSPLTECDDGQTIMALAAAGHGVGFSTDRPLFGIHAINVLDETVNPPRPLSLPLHVVWQQGHFAEASIQQLAHRIQRFLVEHEITLDSGFHADTA
ncbi:LysR family transcriptional regulator [Paenarthrobacter sp. AMU7]|uniref:LysR family transcriptional regulator n=1 Tax=Paenarthrobacter sp. AMU7 TaxID=3162492 RepID=A0AB39YMS4_9MICC